MAHQGNAPIRLGAIHPTTQTPVLATLLASAAVLAFALWLPLVTLAQLTSYLTLLVFALVNLTAWRLHGRTPEYSASDDLEHESMAPTRTLSYPKWLPLLGALICVATLVASFVIELT